MSARRALRGAASERGSAIVELLAVGLVMLLPMVHLVVVVARVQSGAFAVDAGARGAARTVAANPAAPEVVVPVVALALADQGFADGADADVRASCDPDPCSTPGARVLVEVAYDVAVPGVPAGVDAVVPVRVRVTSRSTAVVDRFRAPEAAP